jgi:hypothetical protein
MDIQDSFERFIKDRQAQQCSPRHIEYLRQKFNLLGKYFRAETISDTCELTPDILNSYMLRYIQPDNGKRYSDWYIRGIANVIRAYLRFLRQMRIIPEEIPFTMPRFHRPLPQLVEADRMASERGLRIGLE